MSTIDATIRGPFNAAYTTAFIKSIYATIHATNSEAIYATFHVTDTKAK